MDEPTMVRGAPGTAFGVQIDGPNGAIDRHATALNVQLQEIHAQLDALAERLTPVLRPDPTADAMLTAESPRPSQSGLADHLEQSMESARFASNRIQAIRDRIDL